MYVLMFLSTQLLMSCGDHIVYTCKDTASLFNWARGFERGSLIKDIGSILLGFAINV